MTKLEKILAVCLVAVVGTLAVVGESNRAIKGQVLAERELIQIQQQVIDSLHSEMFVLSTQLGRVELTLDHLREVMPNAFVEFNQFHDHQTE